MDSVDVTKLSYMVAARRDMDRALNDDIDFYTTMSVAARRVMDRALNDDIDHVKCQYSTANQNAIAPGATTWALTYDMDKGSWDIVKTNQFNFKLDGTYTYTYVSEESYGVGQDEKIKQGGTYEVVEGELFLFKNWSHANGVEETYPPGTRSFEWLTLEKLQAATK